MRRARAFAATTSAAASDTPGRPSLIGDAQALLRFTEALVNLASLEDAALMADVDPSTAYRCLQRGRRAARKAQRGEGLPERERRFREFFEVTRLCMAEAKVGLIRMLYDASRKDWRCAMKMLERRYPEEWGPVHVANPDDEQVGPLPAFVVRRMPVNPNSDGLGDGRRAGGSVQP